MKIEKANARVVNEVKIGRNDPCICVVVVKNIKSVVDKSIIIKKECLITFLFHE